MSGKGKGDAVPAGGDPKLGQPAPAVGPQQDHLYNAWRWRASAGVVSLAVGALLGGCLIHEAHGALEAQATTFRDTMTALLNGPGTWAPELTTKAAELETWAYMTTLGAHGVVATGGIYLCWQLIKAGLKLGEPLWGARRGGDDDLDEPSDAAFSVLERLADVIGKLRTAVTGGK